MRITRLALFGLFSAALSFGATVNAEQQEKELETTQDLNDTPRIPEWVKLHPANEELDVSCSESPQFFSNAKNQQFSNLVPSELLFKSLFVKEKMKHCIPPRLNPSLNLKDNPRNPWVRNA